MFVSSGQDALSRVDAMQKQIEAREHNDRGGQLMMQGRYAAAAKEFRRAIEANPLNATAHSNLGLALYKQRRLKEAISWLEKALAIDPRLEGVPEALVQYKAEAKKKLFNARRLPIAVPLLLVGAYLLLPTLGIAKPPVWLLVIVLIGAVMASVFISRHLTKQKQ